MWQALQASVCCSSKEGSFETKVFLQKYSIIRLPSFGTTPVVFIFVCYREKHWKFQPFIAGLSPKERDFGVLYQGNVKFSFVSHDTMISVLHLDPAWSRKQSCLCVWKHLIEECLRAHVVVKHTAAKRLSEFCPRSSCVGLFPTVCEPAVLDTLETLYDMTPAILLKAIH